MKSWKNIFIPNRVERHALIVTQFEMALRIQRFRNLVIYPCKRFIEPRVFFAAV
jgi:hypothetical protein